MDVHINPELEEILQDSVDAGRYASTEEAVAAAISLLEQQNRWIPRPGATGADLIAAMQASPFKEIELETPGRRLPVREPAF